MSSNASPKQETNCPLPLQILPPFALVYLAFLQNFAAVFNYYSTTAVADRQCCCCSGWLLEQRRTVFMVVQGHPPPLAAAASTQEV